MSLLFVTCFSMLFVGGFGDRVIRAVGDQPPLGECCSFAYGGADGMHWYSCCNNCDEDPNTCDATTYQTGSTNDYCGPCGVDTAAGNGTKLATFPCDGCDGQAMAMEECSALITSIYQIPKLCWLFVFCFEEKCEEKAGVEDIPDTCFNLQCDAGEDVNNCSIDCCGAENPMCIPEDGKCPPRCCSEPTCCNGLNDCDNGGCDKYEVMRCGSKKMKPNTCNLGVLGNILGITVAKQLSKKPCIAGVTYFIIGVDELLVKDGCRADFYCCFKPRDCHSHHTSILCESWKFQFASCAAPGFIVDIAVEDKQSKSPCIFGDSYSVAGNMIEVDKGCRAVFAVCYV